MLKDRFDGTVVVDGRNDPDTLARLDDDEVLYSKLETKKHLVGTRIKVMGQVVHDDGPFNEWVEKWF